MFHGTFQNHKEKNMSLSVSRLVNVSVTLSPQAVGRRGFGTLMIAGDSTIIDGLERFRSYTGITDVATDFGTSAPEYLAAALYFGQNPKPKNLMIGRWLRTATSGLLKGGILSTVEQTIATWQAITAGGFKYQFDGGTLTNVTGLNFSGCANLNAVAAVISAALTGGTCTYSGSRFILTSNTTGVSSAVAPLVAPASGVDISSVLKMSVALASPAVPGYAAETPVACVTALATKSSSWYGVMFAAATFPNDAERLTVAALVQSLVPSRIYAITTTNTTVLDSTITNDIASQLRDLGYTRTCIQYSSHKYAIASFIGRAFAVDFNANRSTIDMMYKQEPGITGEELTETQAQTLQTKRCNVFVKYDNDTSIIQYGVMSGPAYFDEIHGLDWFQNAVQVDCYNLLYTGKTKIPQTDAGVNQIVNAVNGVCESAVNNGLVAGGTWNAEGFGQLSRGDYLKTGFYIYAQPVALQSQADREARKAPPIQVALKLAGSIQTIDVLVNVNR
jgi:hypothetical protein